MATRIRSILIDNTISKVYTNVVKPSLANSSNVIAGTTKQGLTLAAFGSTSALRIVSNLMGRTNGYPIVSNTLITNFRITLKSPAIGGFTGARLVLKVGTTYASAVAVATISTFATSASVATGILVEPGQNLYLDVTGTGTVKPGIGLTVGVDYYVA